MKALALHGFLGRGADWGAFAAAAARPGLVLDTPDLPGHGPDPRPVPGHFTAWVHWLCDRLSLGPAPVHLLGYSMGGRLALAVALAEAGTGKVASLTLLGASPGLATAAERRARVDHDRALAEELAALGLDRFLDRWYRQPLFGGAVAALGLPALIERRRDAHAEALARALVAAGTGSMPNLRPALPNLDLPVLVLAGEHDPKFCALGQEIADGAPDGQLATVADAGHALLIEAPDRCARLWSEFIDVHVNPARNHHE